MQKLSYSKAFLQEIGSRIANDDNTQKVFDFDKIFTELERNLSLINFKNYQLSNCLETLENQIKVTQKIADELHSELFDRS